MGGDVEIRSPADCFDRPLEALVAEGFDGATALADDVMMMATAGFEAFVTGGLGPEIDALDQAEILELLQGPVDAGTADSLEPAIDLEGGHRAALGPKQFDHAAPGATASVPGLAQGAEGVLRPVGVETGGAGGRRGDTTTISE